MWSCDATGACNEKVEQCPEEVGEENKEHPEKFFTSAQRLIEYTINEHPYPKEAEEQGNYAHAMKFGHRIVLLSFPGQFANVHL